jgi:hypothetical protein
MSLHPQEIPLIPEETARVARAILPQGNRSVLLRDELGTIYTDELFADVYPRLGQPAEHPWRLALVTVMQFMENYTDRQAANAPIRHMCWRPFAPSIAWSVREKRCELLSMTCARGVNDHGQICCPHKQSAERSHRATESHTRCNGKLVFTANPKVTNSYRIDCSL